MRPQEEDEIVLPGDDAEDVVAASATQLNDNEAAVGQVEPAISDVGAGAGAGADAGAGAGAGADGRSVAASQEPTTTAAISSAPASQVSLPASLPAVSSSTHVKQPSDSDGGRSSMVVAAGTVAAVAVGLMYWMRS